MRSVVVRLPAPIGAAEIEVWLVGRLAELLEFEPDEIELDAPFIRYGLESLQAAELVAGLEEWLDISIPALDFLGASGTIAEAARRLVEERERQHRRPA